MPRGQPGIPQCSIDGCDRPNLARGLCPAHYDRWRRGSDLTPPIANHSPNRLPCSVPGCTALTHGRGWCLDHYTNWRRRGDPMSRPTPSTRCGACRHPSAASLDLDLLGGVDAVLVASTYSIGHSTVARHRTNHLGMVPIRGAHSPCTVCSHPESAEIDDLWSMRGQHRFQPPHLRSSAIAERFGVTVSALHRHDTPEHQQRRAQYELGRLNALKETA